MYGDIIILKLATNSSTLGDVSEKEKPQGHGSMKGKERKARLAKKKKRKRSFYIIFKQRSLCTLTGLACAHKQWSYSVR